MAIAYVHLAKVRCKRVINIAIIMENNEIRSNKLNYIAPTETQILFVTNHIKCVLEDAFLVSLNTKVSSQTVIALSDNLQLVPISWANHIGDLMKVEDHRQHKVKLKQIRNSSGL